MVLGGGASLAVAVAVKHQRTLAPLAGERWRLRVWRLWLPRVVRGAAHWVEAATPLLFGPHGGRPPSHREGGRHVLTPAAVSLHGALIHYPAVSITAISCNAV